MLSLPIHNLLIYLFCTVQPIPKDYEQLNMVQK